MWTRTGTWISGATTSSRSNGAPRASSRCRRPSACSIWSHSGCILYRRTAWPVGCDGWLTFGLRRGSRVERRPPSRNAPVDLIVSPATVALNPQQGAAVPALKAGDIIEAKVLELLGSLAKLGIGKSIIEVQTQVPLTLGATVRLAVKTTPDGIRLTLLGNAPNAGGTPGTANPLATSAAQVAGGGVAAESAGASGAAPLAAGTLAGAATDTATTVAANAAAPQSQPALPQPPHPAAAAVAALAVAVQTAAARQGGLAPLLADIGVA